MGTGKITVEHGGTPRPTGLLTQCFHYIVAEKAIHCTFYVQLLENRLNANARKIFEKTLSLVKSFYFEKSGAPLGTFIKS